MQKAGWDIGKVLQRYLFTLTTDIEKLQYSYDELQGSVPFTLSNDRNCKTLEISLPARIISKLQGG
jgi:hypothetical protein